MMDVIKEINDPQTLHLFFGALYNVEARGNQRQTIFQYEEDYKNYLAYLSEYRAKYNFRL